MLLRKGLGRNTSGCCSRVKPVETQVMTMPLQFPLPEPSYSCGSATGPLHLGSILCRLPGPTSRTPSGNSSASLKHPVSVGAAHLHRLFTHSVNMRFPHGFPALNCLGHMDSTA